MAFEPSAVVEVPAARTASPWVRDKAVDDGVLKGPEPLLLRGRYVGGTTAPLGLVIHDGTGLGLGVRATPALPPAAAVLLALLLVAARYRASR